MGLDMYLSEERYFSNYDHAEEKERARAHSVALAAGFDPALLDRNGSVTAAVNIAYWRKAHWLHEWFVNNIQNGEDNCGSHSVELEHLKEILDGCRAIMVFRATASIADAEECMNDSFPCQYPHGEWIWESVQDTIDQLQLIVDRAEREEGDGIWREYIYRSSW